MIGSVTKDWLLGIARAAIAARLASREPGLPERPEGIDPVVDESRAVFVTLRRKGKLRGCIGAFEATQPLCQAVATYAVQSGFCDPRFSPLVESELDGLAVSISVLTPPQPLDDPSKVQVGVHGILIQGKGKFAGQRGCYLPEVATEHDMDGETFLTHCCVHKARLSPDAWRTQELAEIQVFTTETLDEDA